MADLDAIRAAHGKSEPTVEVNVTVNDQNVVVISDEIRTMAPWISENEVQIWARRIAKRIAEHE